MIMAPLGLEDEAPLGDFLAEFSPAGEKGFRHSVKEQEQTRAEAQRRRERQERWEWQKRAGWCLFAVPVQFSLCVSAPLREEGSRHFVKS
jgi:hypothetical protein